MRLSILDSGHTTAMKAKFAIIRAMSRLPVPDAIKLNRYRPEFYGTPMRKLTQEALRGPSNWSVGDRELMGAVISQANQCQICTKTHGGVAALAYGDETRVSQALSDVESSELEQPLRATLLMLRKLSADRSIAAEDMRAVLAAGATRQQIVDALAVSFAFNTVDRLSRTFGWAVVSEQAFRSGSEYLLARGYY